MENNIKILKDNLTAKGFFVHYFETSKEAVDFLEKEIKDQTVAFGGSTTVKDLNIIETLEKNNKVLVHTRPGGDSSREAFYADSYVTSVNAISETGELINIDGNGNRVAATIFGPKKVYYVVGKNKIEKDLVSAIYRARNVAGPMNAKRLNRKTPCAVKGDKCYDCKSPERICNVMSITANKVSSHDTIIILVNENLGF